MKVLITGSTGFIGRHLCAHLLERGDSVICIDRVRREPRPSLVGLDWSSDWQSDLPAVDAIVHLAARAHVLKDASLRPELEYQRINKELALSVAHSAIRQRVKRFVFLSSVGVLGNSGSFSDESPFAPVEDYAVSKMHAELGLAELFAGNLESFLTVIRPPLVYGPGVGGNFGRLLRLSRRSPVLPLGSVRALRSYVGVRNLCDLISVCLESPHARARTFLVSDGQDLSLAELLGLMRELRGRGGLLLPFPCSILEAMAAVAGKRKEAEKLLGTLTVNIEGTRSSLSWTPPYGLRDELSNTLSEAV